MIIGLGSDIIDIRRIERSLARFGRRFVDRVFTEGERERSDGRVNRAASYARRFAAKEACAKALGTGIDNSVFGATWAWSISAQASRPCSFPAERSGACAS